MMKTERWNFLSKKFKKYGKGSEHSIQKGFFEFLSKVYPQYRMTCFSIPNDGARGLIQGSLLKQSGLTRGVPDVFCAIASNGYPGLFIEFKKDGGIPSVEQLMMIDRLKQNGYKCEICYGLEQAIKIFSEYVEN